MFTNAVPAATKKVLNPLKLSLIQFTAEALFKLLCHIPLTYFVYRVHKIGKNQRNRLIPMNGKYRPSAKARSLLDRGVSLDM